MSMLPNQPQSLIDGLAEHSEVLGRSRDLEEGEGALEVGIPMPSSILYVFDLKIFFIKE